MTETSPELRIGAEFDSAYDLFTDQSPATKPYRAYVTGDGASFGTSDPIERVIDTFLADIQTVVIDGQGPRPMTFTVWVTADTVRALAGFEADVMAELYKPNLLWWRPPHPASPWAVFEVSSSSLSPMAIGETDYEETQLERGYVISLTCGAWVRSKDELVTAMPAGSDVEVVLNAGTDDGVTTTSSGATIDVDEVGGTLVVGFTPTLGPWSGTVRFVVAEFDQAETPLLVVEGDGPFVTTETFDWTLSVFSTARSIGNTPLSLSTYVVTSDGWRATYVLPVGLWDGLLFSYASLLSPIGVEVNFTYDSIVVTDAAQSIGTLRQKMFPLEVKGSVDARGMIEVTNVDPIGMALVYSFVDPTDGYYMPVLSLWRDPASTNSRTANPANASGYTDRVNMGQQLIYSVPLRAIPDGVCDLVFRATSADVDGGHPTITPQIWSGDYLLEILDPLTGHFAYDGGAYHYYVAGQIEFPLLRVTDDTDLGLRLIITNDDSGSAPVFDDGYLLNIDIGAYSLVNCGGTPADDVSALYANYLSLESPTFQWPAPSVMVGVDGVAPTHHAPSGAAVELWGRHTLLPGGNRVLVVTDAVDSAARARYYPRGHTNLEW